MSDPFRENVGASIRTTARRPGPRPSHRTWRLPPSGAASRLGREGLWDSATRHPAPRDPIVLEEFPVLVDLLWAPCVPAAPTPSFRTLPAREATDLQVHLPSNELQVLRRVPPSEVVHPSPHARVDHLSDDLLHRNVQAVTERGTERAEESSALLLLWAAQGQLLAGVRPGVLLQRLGSRARVRWVDLATAVGVYRLDF